MGFGSGFTSGRGITSGSVFLLHISSPSGLVWFRFGFACLGMVLPYLLLSIGHGYFLL